MVGEACKMLSKSRRLAPSLSACVSNMVIFVFFWKHAKKERNVEQVLKNRCKRLRRRFSRKHVKSTMPWLATTMNLSTGLSPRLKLKYWLFHCFCYIIMFRSFERLTCKTCLHQSLASSSRQLCILVWLMLLHLISPQGCVCTEQVNSVLFVLYNKKSILQEVRYYTWVIKAGVLLWSVVQVVEFPSSNSCSRIPPFSYVVSKREG